MHRLEKIEIAGFKSIKKQSFNLGAINLLIGANGSGKSNFIEAFAFLGAITEGRLDSYVGKSGGAERILHFGSKVTDKIKFHAFFNDSVDQYKIELEPSELDKLYPSYEVAYYWLKANYAQPYSTVLSGDGIEANISKKSQSGVKSYVKQALESWRVYHFHDTGPSSPMKKVADIDDNRFLRTDGSNLAAFLYFLKLKAPDEYGLLTKTIRKIAPFFDEFVLEPRTLDEQTIRIEWRHKNTDSYFDISSFSDGTLRFIALATLLLQPDKYKPSVILLDEPELGLHPFAITVLGSMIKAASINSQLIVSTQSPFLLDQFEPEDVVVVSREDDGSTFSRLDSENLSDWLEDYSLGQLWEKNELGGRPSKG